MKKYRSDSVILGGPTWDVADELSLSSLGEDSGGGRIICGAPWLECVFSTFTGFRNYIQF